MDRGCDGTKCLVMMEDEEIDYMTDPIEGELIRATPRLIQPSISA
jgi:hypothetical protein